MLDLEHYAAVFEDVAPQTILRWAAKQFGKRLAVVTSFQHTGIVTLHMLQRIAPDVDVLTLDTGNLFPETYDLIERVEADFNLNLHRIQPDPADLAGTDPHLWATHPDECCYLRKVLPLKRALAGYDAWITGLRRDQSPTRANTPIITRDEKHGNIKIAPFSTWTSSMIETYIEVHQLPYNALYDQDYHSIGCMPCTRHVQPGEHSRAGRWADKTKSECGIHT